MAARKSYTIGPQLLGDIRRVIANQKALSTSGAEFPVRLQTLQRRGGAGASKMRICTFTGSWTKSTTKTVTFKYETNTPNTVTVTNLFSDISVDCGTRNCAIASEGTAWFLIAAECP